MYPDSMEFVLLLPKAGIPLRTLNTGSLAVAEAKSWASHGPTIVHYEGGIYDPAMKPFTKVELAAGRLWKRYPTIACIGVDAAGRQDWLVIGKGQLPDLKVSVDRSTPVQMAVLSAGMWPEEIESPSPGGRLHAAARR